MGLTSIGYWRGTRLDAMSRTDLISALTMTQTELDRERNGQAFKDRVLSLIQPFTSEEIEKMREGVEDMLAARPAVYRGGRPWPKSSPRSYRMTVNWRALDVGDIVSIGNGYANVGVANTEFSPKRFVSRTRKGEQFIERIL